jgi:hypothetical protein
MLRRTLFGLAVATIATAAVITTSASAKTCVNKAGEGTGSNAGDAEFQAYEAVLQATSWPMWSSWMASGAKVGVAPGYAVTNYRKKCGAGGTLGYSCRVQATLCN